MKKILFLMALFVQLLAFGQGSCNNAVTLQPSQDGTCVLQNYQFANLSSSYWVQFSATATAYEFILNSVSLSQVQFSSVKLYSGNCVNLVLEETITPNATSDTLVFDSLTTEQIYFIQIERSDSHTAGYFQICVVEKAIDSYWTNNFTNSTGGTLLNCLTDFPANLDPPNYGNMNCNEVIVCINDVLDLEIIAPIDLSGILNDPNPCPHYLIFANQNGAIASPVSTTITTLTTLSFTQIGQVSFYLIPEIYEIGTVPYNSIINDIDQRFLFTITVIGEQPEAVWDNQIICNTGTATLSSPDLSIFSNVTVDGNPFPADFQLEFNSADFSVGTHTVEYTLTGACGAVTYTTTFTVIADNDLTVTIDNCGNAVFDFVSCTLLGAFNATLTCGDGTILTGSLDNGTITFTHHYTNTIGIGWTFLVEYPNGIDAFSQSGVISPIAIQPISLSSPLFLCEMTIPVSITSPTSGLQNIVWSTNPINVFTGQGTTVLTPDLLTWGNSTSDITVTVNAFDVNGCPYQGTVTIQECCGPKGQPENTEYFERTYYTHSSFAGLNFQIPASSYFAPTNVAIALPNPPSTVINTLYSTPTTLSSLIATNGWTVTNGQLTIVNPLYVNNDLIIDMSILITNSNFIRLAPDVRIIVNPTVSFKMLNSTLAPKCDEMWGGIVLSTSNSSLVFDRVNVIGAKKGIEALNSADIDVLSCVFVDNYIGIQIQNDATAAPDKIRNTYFGDVPNVPLLFPYNTQLIPETGILFDLVDGLTIGSNVLFNGTPATSGNLFHKMKRGIDGFRSTFYVYRNAFYEMKHAPGQIFTNQGDTYCGVRADGFKSSGKSVFVANALTNRNVFVSCEYGVSAKRGINTDVRNNYMRDIMLRGISCEENPTRNIQIWDNFINSTNQNAFGIYSKNYAGGIVNIRRNSINTSAGAFTNLVARFASGIFVSSVTPNVAQTTTIVSNTVNNCLYGVWVLNMPLALVDQNTININMTDGIINNLTASYANIRGIVAQNSDKIKIRNNTITRNNGFATGVTNDQLQGIRLEICPASEVWKNTMTRTSVGFYALGSSIGSKVECNLMHLNRNGFWMQSADISTQGSASGLSAQNKWTANVLNNTDGTTINHGATTPLYYFHQSGATFGSNPTIQILSPPYYWTDVILSGATTNTCGSAVNLEPITLTTTAQDRTKEMSAVVNGGVIYDSLDVEMKHYLHQSVLSRLKQNPTLQTLNTPDDATYQFYVLSMEQSQTTGLLKAQEAMATEQHDSAMVYINALDVSDPKIALNQTVEAIWNTAKLNDVVISTADSLVLFDIACSDPLINGSAVYQARAMLDWDGTCAQMMQRTTTTTLETEQTTPSLVVYPNPSNGLFSITASSVIETVEIIDLKGAILSTFKVDAENYDVKTQLIAGIYVLRVRLLNGNVETHKIEIQ